MPTTRGPLGAQRRLPVRFSDLRAVFLAVLLAAGVAGVIATVAPGEDARAPDA